MQMVTGPAWSPPGLDLAGGRYPLRVEAHVGRLVGGLLPGVITTTFQARQYSAHALGWAEAKRRGLSQEDAQELLRRIEVVLAGVSLQHSCPVWLPGAHGADVVGAAIDRDGVLNVARLQEPGRYAAPRAGFASTYHGAEVLLGMLRSGWPPQPGERLDERVVRSALGDLLPLAELEQVDLPTLAAAEHLCVCGAALGAPDAPWLRQLLLDPTYRGPNEGLHAARVATSKLLLAAVARNPDLAPLDAFRNELCFGDFLAGNPTVAGIREGLAWRGVMLRNFSVGSWRRLWAWIVNGLDEPATPAEMAAHLAETLPPISVSELVDELPRTAANGVLLPAEIEIREESSQPDPASELRMLALGAQRLKDLDGVALAAFGGRADEDDLGPRWFARHLDASMSMALPDFGRDLAERLIARSRRVALSKTELRPDGTIWMPSRLREHAGLLVRRDTEGWGDVSLRIDTYAQVLAGAGVLHHDDTGWRLTEHGEALVG